MIKYKLINTFTKRRRSFSMIEIEDKDYSKCNYGLTKALYYASIISDQNGDNHGKGFQLGAVFCKPIINSTIAFTLPDPIQIDIQEGDEEIEKDVNEFLSNQNGTMLKFVKNGFRDGDSYLYFHMNGVVSIISPDYVTKFVDPINGNRIIGYDIKTVVASPDKEGEKESYILSIRKDYEKNTVTESASKISSDGTKKEISKIVYEDAPMKMVHFANELEPGDVYGQTEFQGLYYLIRNYHSVEEQAIKSNIFNNTPIPYVTGASSLSDFKTENETTDSVSGKKTIKWQAGKMLTAGKDAKFGMLEAMDSTKGSIGLLQVLFWQICQNSETPEFVMGTAVSSSKASVSEQVPVMVKKASRKQTELTPVFEEIINIYMWVAGQNRNGLYTGVDIKEVNYKIVMPQILSDDLKLNLEIVKALLTEGTITKATAMKMLSVDKYVTDIDLEVEKANKEEEDSINRGSLFNEVDTERAKDEKKKQSDSEEEEDKETK